MWSKEEITSEKECTALTSSECVGADGEVCYSLVEQNRLSSVEK